MLDLCCNDREIRRQRIAEKIKCPTLVCDAMLRFTTAEGAGTHCEVGASRLAYARIYDWLDETLA